MMQRGWALIAACGVLCGCSVGTATPDAGVSPGADAGRRVDTGAPTGACLGGYMYSPASCGDPEAEASMRNLDSDSDGLTDYEELCRYSTDPCNADSDADGFTDLAEVAARTDPSDAASRIPDTDFFVVLPYFGAMEQRPLRFGTDIQRADVYFLIDTTGSMGDPIANVRSSLSRISGELTARIPDVQMGVGHFEDFPNGANCGTFDITCLASAYGAAGDVAYANVQDITADVPAVQAALNGLTLGNGADSPESQVEALYQTATGAGGSWTFSNGAPTHAIAPRTCPTWPDEITPRRGYPCFRGGALPIIVLVADIGFHNGPGGASPYSGITPPPHTFDDAVTALGDIGARAIGVAVDGGGEEHQRTLAQMTGTVDASGSPLVYNASGGSVSDAIIEGIGALVGTTPQDVTTQTSNVTGNPDEFDATQFIKGIVPLEGYREGVAGARPGISYASRDETTFYGVIPGTVVEFQVDFYNDVRMPADITQIFRANIFVVGNGVATLDERRVYILVPRDGGTILI